MVILLPACAFGVTIPEYTDDSNPPRGPIVPDLDTFGEIKRILVDLVGVDESQVTFTTRFREDLECNSDDLSAVFLMFEDTFGVEISDEEAQKITTVGQAVEFIIRHEYYLE